MAKIDHRLAESDIPVEKYVQALVTLIVQQLNQLRAFHGLQGLTRDQVITALKNIVKTL